MLSATEMERGCFVFVSTALRFSNRSAMPKTSESSQILLSSKPLRTMRINFWHFQCNVYFKQHHRRRHHRGRHHRRRHDRLLHNRNRVRHGDVAIHHHLTRHRARDRNRHLYQCSEKVALQGRNAEWQRSLCGRRVDKARRVRVEGKLRATWIRSSR